MNGWQLLKSQLAQLDDRKVSGSSHHGDRLERPVCAVGEVGAGKIVHFHRNSIYTIQ